VTCLTVRQVGALYAGRIAARRYRACSALKKLSNRVTMWDAIARRIAEGVERHPLIAFPPLDATRHNDFSGPR
jgi:hypothetical protein